MKNLYLLHTGIGRQSILRKRRCASFQGWISIIKDRWRQCLSVQLYPSQYWIHPLHPPLRPSGSSRFPASPTTFYSVLFTFRTAFHLRCPMRFMKCIQNVIEVCTLYPLRRRIWLTYDNHCGIQGFLLRIFQQQNTHQKPVLSRSIRLFHFCDMMQSTFYFPLPNGPPANQGDKRQAGKRP